MKKKIYLILLIFWLFVIYYLSNQTGDLSGNNSGTLIKLVFSYIFNIMNINIDIDNFIDIVHNPIRELMHMIEYMILAFLVIKNLINFNSKENVYIITLLFNFIYACFDEIHQLFIIGRSFEYFDILMNMIGSIVVIIIFRLYNISNETDKNY